MNMVSKVSDARHWKQLTDTEYIGAYALEPGQDMVLTIHHVEMGTVTSTGGKKDRKPIMHFVENVLPMVLNSTNMRMIEKVHGIADPNKWGGKKIQLYADKTRLSGELVDCLRIRPYVPREEAKIKCERCGEILTASSNMTAQQLADYGRKTFGKVLCVKCGKLAREAASKGEPLENIEPLRKAGETHEGGARPDPGADAGNP